MANHPNRSKQQSAEDWVGNLRVRREQVYAAEYLAWLRSGKHTKAPSRGPIAWERAAMIRDGVAQRS